MKFFYYLFLTSLFCILMVAPANQVEAVGTFQLPNFNSSNTAISGYPYSRTIDFLYSGNSTPEHSLIGTNLPKGMEVGSIVNKGSGLYSFAYKGTPEQAGEYPLILTLTDNMGALLTQSYTFKVVEPKISFLTQNLPSGIVHEPYSATINISYIGNIWISFLDFPVGFSYYVDTKINATEYQSGTKIISITGEGTYVNNHVFKVSATISGQPVYDRLGEFAIDIKNASIATKSTTPINNTQPTQSTTTSAESDELNKGVEITNFVEAEKKKLITIDTKLSKRLKGKILLQVENHGEAWYVNPKDSKKYYMANGNEAYTIMRNSGVGITNKDLEKVKSDKNFAKKHSGKIFLQVEDKGQAYYIDSDGNEHYLKNGEEAYSIMRELGLGITNSDIRKIDIGEID